MAAVQRSFQRGLPNTSFVSDPTGVCHPRAGSDSYFQQGLSIQMLVRHSISFVPNDVGVCVALLGCDVNIQQSQIETAQKIPRVDAVLVCDAALPPVQTPQLIEQCLCKANVVVCLDYAGVEKVYDAMYARMRSRYDVLYSFVSPLQFPFRCYCRSAEFVTQVRTDCGLTSVYAYEFKSAPEPLVECLLASRFKGCVGRYQQKHSQMKFFTDLCISHKRADIVADCMLDDWKTNVEDVARYEFRAAVEHLDAHEGESAANEFIMNVRGCSFLNDRCQGLYANETAVASELQLLVAEEMEQRGLDDQEDVCEKCGNGAEYSQCDLCS